MHIEQYDKVQLKTGKIAWIVEIFDNGKKYFFCCSHGRCEMYILEELVNGMD